MRRGFGKWCLALSLMLAAGVAGTTVCYGQDEVEISDFEDETSEDVDLDTSEDVPDTETVDVEEFDDGDVAEAILSDDEEVADVGTDTSGTYDRSDSATSGAVTLKVEWNDSVLGQKTTFHVSAAGGSGNYKFRMDAPSYSNPDERWFESVADPSRGEWTLYTDICSSYDYDFTMTASGTYNFRFYLMDLDSGVSYLHTNTYIQVSDANHPSVNFIISSAVEKCNSETDGSEYEKALWLHDWLMEQLEYDNSLKWSSSESALTRGLGTCQAYESAYSKLLTAAGIENAETRDTYDGHTWNAVKLDGKWYQVDCTWDDTKDHWYNFDQRHLYFGLTDELMAIAHRGHMEIYTANGYATRSTSLADNYFVRSGEAATWAKAYADRIQEKLNAGETEFTIAADNATDPPSISGIQNGIIAYALNQMSWAVNGEKVSLQASGEATRFNFTISSVTGEKFYGYTLNLDGTIGINMYMILPDSVAANQNAYMKFSLPNGNTSEVKVADARKTADGYYVFTIRVVAKQMADNVTAQMFVDGQSGKTYTVSVQKYADYILRHEYKYTKTVVQLVKSMLNYGAMSQKLFAYNTDNLANSILNTADQAIKEGDFEPYKESVVQAENTGIKWYGSSLLLESDTCIRDYFLLDSSSSIDSYVFYYGSTQLIPEKSVKNGVTYYYVDIPNIKAKDLNQSVVVKVQQKSQPDVNIIELNYNVFSYAYAMKKSENADEATMNVTNAMYQYWQLALQYDKLKVK